MKLLSFAGIGVFIVTSLVVGLRMLLLWHKTRKAPELCLAIAVLFIGFLAFAVGTTGKLFLSAGEQLRSALTITGLLVEYIGDGALVAFAWRVFHPRERWARNLVVALGLLALGAVAGEIYTGEYLRYSDPERIRGPWVPFSLCVRALAPLWLAFECLRYHGNLRRRLALGLAEPLVVHRVFLWGLSMMASTGGYVLAVVHRLLYGTGLREHVWALSAVSALATISALCIGVAFFPPAFYRRWAARDSGST